MTKQVSALAAARERLSDAKTAWFEARVAKKAAEAAAAEKADAWADAARDMVWAAEVLLKAHAEMTRTKAAWADAHEAKFDAMSDARETKEAAEKAWGDVSKAVYAANNLAATALGDDK
jgi:hypothetical protein